MIPIDAWSIDGRHFVCRGPVTSGFGLGRYLEIRSHGAPARLGQVLSGEVVERVEGRHVELTGRFIDTGVGDPFDGAEVGIAPREMVLDAITGGRSALGVGSLVGAPAIPAQLSARGFNRHTFVCGQSGSGKTYALGVLLEQLVLRTRLPLLILDPNGDHVHLGRTRPEIDDATASTFGREVASLQLLAAEPGPEAQALRVRFDELGIDGPEALLRLDAITDRDEYNAVLHFIEQAAVRGIRTVQDAVHAMRTGDDPVLVGVSRRAENLGVDRMAVWASTDDRTLSERWEQDRPRVLVADTSGFEGRRERLAVAVAVLQRLWVRRRDRRALLLVVDEAHDVCPAEPDTPLQRLAVELFTRIAGEGRKYGIHLLLASQRPDKLPDNVLSQCDNLMLMRVNSAGDRRALADRFGFAPRGLVELAGSFGLGEALFAGRVAPDPLLVRIGERLTPEGGADVPLDWAH